MILKIIYRNLVYKPLNAMLSLILLMLSVAIISLLLVANKQVNEKLDKDLQDIDMVVGAKGSPLQLVLSAIYHVDAPTGNISKKEADKLLKNPMIERAIPLAYGDSYKGYRILGTTAEYVKIFNASLKEGKIFENQMEVVLGAGVAKRTGLKPGDTFHGTHGEDARGQVHEDVDYRIVGVLNATGTVIDQLLLTNVKSVWHIHDDEHEDKEEKQDEVRAENEVINEEEHADEEEHNHAEDEHDKQITALLVKFRSPMGIMMLPRMINEQTSMQAAIPTLEINRLVNLMGIGITTLQGIALAIMLIAGLSVFVSLYNRLKERKFEHALMRSMGTSRSVILLLLLAEGLLLSVIGFIAGIALCRVGLVLLTRVASEDFRFTFSYGWVPQEWWLFGITLIIGIFASAIPAIKAYRLNIAKTLSDG
jgi:putative ABC transport system permease protein